MRLFRLAVFARKGDPEPVRSGYIHTATLEKAIELVDEAVEKLDGGMGDGHLHTVMDVIYNGPPDKSGNVVLFHDIPDLPKDKVIWDGAPELGLFQPVMESGYLIVP